MTFYVGHVPQSYTSVEFTFLPLTPKYTELDYGALMSSKSTLRDWSGGTWPRDDFTLDENRADLQQHWEEFESGEAYAYTILNPDETRCEGCFYADQLLRLLKRYDVMNQVDEPIGEGDVLIDFGLERSD